MYLITGAQGFVGKHLIRYLIDEVKIDKSHIVGVYRSKVRELPFDIHYINLDLNNKEELSKLLKDISPKYIVHLASHSSVGYSWKDPIGSYNNNLNIFLNLLEAVRCNNLEPRILSVGSSEEYGLKLNGKLKESDPLIPSSPYAVARVSQELLSKVYISGYGLKIVMTRSFNHIGTGQSPNFVISSFTKKLLDKKLKSTSNKIRVGNLDIVRDFTNVKDIVRAYNLLLHEGEVGQVYNICSGIGTSLKQIITKIASEIDVEFEIDVDPNLLRPNDNPYIVGDNNKIFRNLNWKPKVDMDQSIKEIVEYWKKQIDENTL